MLIALFITAGCAPTLKYSGEDAAVLVFSLERNFSQSYEECNFSLTSESMTTPFKLGSLRGFRDKKVLKNSKGGRTILRSDGASANDREFSRIYAVNLAPGIYQPEISCIDAQCDFTTCVYNPVMPSEQPEPFILKSNDQAYFGRVNFELAKNDEAPILERIFNPPFTVKYHLEDEFEFDSNSAMEIPSMNISAGKRWRKLSKGLMLPPD